VYSVFYPRSPMRCYTLMYKPVFHFVKLWNGLRISSSSVSVLDRLQSSMELHFAHTERELDLVVGRFFRVGASHLNVYNAVLP
jgi:hypothetical protein